MLKSHGRRAHPTDAAGGGAVRVFAAGLGIGTSGTQRATAVDIALVATARAVVAAGARGGRGGD